MNELSDEDRNAFMEDVTRVTRAMQKAFNPEKINYGAYSVKMNPGKVYLTDAEYNELIEAVKKEL